MVVEASTWFQKVSSMSATTDHSTPDVFVKSQWQRSASVSVYYVVYRCVFACIFLSIWIASVADKGGEEIGFVGSTFSYRVKWPIYLTHWGITLSMVQAVVGAILVTTERFLDPEKETETIKMKHSFRVYSILHNIALVGALGITVIYWSFIYDPDTMPLSVLNLSLHVGNSVLMLLDLIIIAFPTRLIDIYWPLLYSALYSVFNIIYYLAGGTDRKGHRYVYTILDWTKPGKCVIVLLLSLVFVMILQVCVSMLSMLRRRVGERWHRQQTNIVDSRDQRVSNEIPISDLA